MNTFDSQNQIERLIADCQSELLNHTLQGEVISTPIKRVKIKLDQCLDILMGHGQEELSTKSTRIRVDEEARKDILFFAYCISKYDFPFVNAITSKNFNQGESFDYLAAQLNVNRNTLRNHRDSFDSHVEQVRSSRVGWKKPLTEEFKKIVEEYKSFDEHELIKKAEEILSNDRS